MSGLKRYYSGWTKYKIIKINRFLLFNNTGLDKILGHLFNNFAVYTAHRINIRQY